MLEGGADIRFIMDMLGHDNLESTAIYTRVSVEKLRAVHEATHPARLHRAEGGPNASPDDLEALRAILDTDDEDGKNHSTTAFYVVSACFLPSYIHALRNTPFTRINALRGAF